MFQDLTDRDIVELMNAMDSDNFNSKHLAYRWHSPRWYTLMEELRRRHADDWDAWITVQ